MISGMSQLVVVFLFCGAIAGNVMAEDVVIPAREHSARSSQVVPVDMAYSGLVVCHGANGMQQWKFDLKEAGRYYIHGYYASGQERPMKLAINNQLQAGECFGRNTGGFQKVHLRWETMGPFDFRKGLNTVQVNATGTMPHLGGLVISANAKEWNQKAFSYLSKSDEELAVERIAAMEGQMTAARATLRKKLGTDEIVFIKRIPYTSNHYYTEYLNTQWTPGGGIYILSLKDGSERQIAVGLTDGVFGRMDLSFDAKKVIFDWKRSNDEGYRIYEVGIDGKGLRQILQPPANEAELIKKYRLGYHNGTDDMHPCYLPDGGIAFVSTRCQTSTLCHGGDLFTTPVIYRMDGDGGNLKQLSFGALSEFTPTVLPDGRIMYARWEYINKGAVSSKCIWAMQPDGTASVEIYGNDITIPTTMIQARAIPNTFNKYVILGCPHYPQNALGTIIRLDMNKPIRTYEPMTYMTPDVKVLEEAGWHFKEGDSDKMVMDSSGSGPLFRDPWPIDEDYFLVAHKPRGFGSCYTKNGYGLYLLESTGHVSPFYLDATISCWQPMALKARKRPPVLQSITDDELVEKNMAKCIVTDVHHGMENVVAGTIKYLRILEQIPRPWSARRFDPENPLRDHYDQQHAVVSKDTALGLKVQHGVVPVESDGSAYFLVPANANIYMQALDENYLAVQTERTFINFMPGEVRSCIGCHETPNDAPPLSRSLIAMKRSPSLPGPQIGETTGRRPLHYAADVQPVLDRHCIRCHDEREKKGGLDLTGRMTTFFTASYENLITERRGARQDRVDPGLVPTIGENHPKTGNVSYLPSRSMGSHNSLLMAMLMPDAIKLTGDDSRMKRLAKLIETHKDLKLKKEELLKISNWVDTNAQYYGSYYGRRNIKDRDHSNFRPIPSWSSAIGIPPLPEDQR